MLAAGEILNSSFLAVVSMMFMLLAMMWAAGGAALVRQLLPAWLFLWLIIPPPFGLDNVLVLMLQRLTTKWSSALLDQCRIFHVIAGNVVEVASRSELGSRRLFVDEACAGINSLFSIVTCAIFYVFFMRTGPIRSVLLILASISWVLLANVVRVFLVAYVAARSSIDPQTGLPFYDIAEGWRHDTLGYALFAVALGLIWSTDRLLMFLTPARWRRTEPAIANVPKPGEETDRAAAVASLRGSWMNSWIAGTAFALLLAGHVALYTLPAKAQPVQPGESLDLAKIDKSALGELDGWRCEKYFEETRNPGSAFGEFSKLWVCQGESLGGGIFSVDYPFPGWHELQECYRNQGWEVGERADRFVKEPGAPSFFSERTLKKSGLRHGHLFFCEFDRTGHVLEAERSGLQATLRRHESALGRLLAYFGNQPDIEDHRTAPPVYQFQLLVESDAPLGSEQAGAVQKRFFKAYQALNKKLLN